MSDDEFDDEPDIDDEDLDDDDLTDDDVDVVDVEDDVLDDDLLDDDVVAAIPDDPAAIIEVPVATPIVEESDDEDDDVVDLDEELHPDDVEEPLDVLLQERTASATLEDDEEDLEEEEVDGDDRADGPTRIVPRRPDEFLCQSCFLLLPLRRLADPERQYCDDCA